MQYPSLDSFLSSVANSSVKGPVAMIFAEDDVELTGTLLHHLKLGFKTVIALMPDEFELPRDLEERVHRVTYASRPRQLVFAAVNRIIGALPDVWLYYCYNAEYLFYPFCETRSVAEMLAFHAEERRNAMLTYVIDLYAEDLEACPTAVSPEAALLDKSGYFAQARTDPATGHPLERQLDFSGGLRWRFDEFIPKESRRMDRIALFRSKPGLELHSNHTFDDPEYNTYSCPWHHNLTAAICSFRAAKALKRNPVSGAHIRTFKWRNSVPFEWNSGQLLDLGLMEPGQWF